MSAPYDPYWICTGCGRVESKNPARYQHDEFLCERCEEELLQAQDFINHMAAMTEHKQ